MLNSCTRAFKIPAQLECNETYSHTCYVKYSLKIARLYLKNVIYLIISEMNFPDTWNWWKLICHSTPLSLGEPLSLSATINLTRKSIFNGILITTDTQARRGRRRIHHRHKSVSTSAIRKHLLRYLPSPVKPRERDQFAASEKSNRLSRVC